MAKKKKIVDNIPAQVVLGEEKIAEIVDKEWEVAPLPSQDELATEQHESPKARSNMNSRKNLIQYRKDVPKETKEAIVNNLQFKHVRADKDIRAFFGELLNDKLIEILLPMREALANEDEEDVFFGIIKHFISDFPKNDLGASDIDDLANLALNRILELRLLKETKEHPRRILDIAASIERFRKNSEKIKMGLANRRMDRIDTKSRGGISIVDLVERFDSDKRTELQGRADKQQLEEDAFEKAQKEALDLIGSSDNKE